MRGLSAFGYRELRRILCQLRYSDNHQLQAGAESPDRELIERIWPKSALSVMVRDCASCRRMDANVARPCECRLAQRAARMLERARIPKRYEHCSLDSYESRFRGANKTLAAAHMRARKFVEGYPIESGGTGLLLTGSIGVGKTHLAVGILQAVIAGAWGLWTLLGLS
jgi:DNA replication protein DnaC